MPIYDEFKGTFPYASELFGVYQPLLGWKSRQAKARVDLEVRESVGKLLENMLNDPRFWGINEKPEVKDPGYIDPLPPDLMDTHVSKYVQSEVVNFFKQKKRSPTGNEWKSIVSEGMLEKALGPAVQSPGGQPLGELGLVFYRKGTMTSREFKKMGAYPIKGTDFMVAKDKNDKIGLEISPGKESVAASALKWLGLNAPDALTSMFRLRNASWEIHRNYVNPLSHFDQEDTTPMVVLSPIGLVRLYRQYFFEFNTFLGSPVGHVWISPGGTVELIEVNTRRELTERMAESITETTTKTEKVEVAQDDLAEAVKQDNDQNIQLGTSASGGGGVGVWHAEGSASFDFTNTNKLSQETTHKKMRQQSEKLSSEIRSSFKTTFRTITETTDMSSRRYVVQNTTDKLVNYELRRKMRKVGVQVQHIGTQLCWQIYVDEPGRSLGIAELVHIAKPADAESPPPPQDAPAILERKEQTVEVSFPYENITKKHNPTWTYKKGRSGDDPEAWQIVWQRKYTASPPALGYTLAEACFVSFRGSDKSRWEPEMIVKVYKVSDDNFQIDLESVDFNENTAIHFTIKLLWNPPDQKKVKEELEKKLPETTEEKQRKAYEEYVKAVQERINLAGDVRPRPFDDLREEERIVVYRQLIQQLMQVGDDRTPHVTAELIRQLFDVDKMLYYVSPDWWTPRQQHRTQEFLQTTLTNDNVIGWGGVREKGRDNYLITEESKPARRGSSIGWLLQLDGDNHRNAFLNSPWVKAIIPIHPGKEVEALKWLKLAYVEGTDGLNAKYGGPEKQFENKTIEEVLRLLAEQIAKENTDINNIVKTETVYEKGFNPLTGGFRATGIPYEIFDQWIEVLPTDQVVAMEYKTKED